MSQGRFVVFEGIDGSGKSTAALEIHKRLTLKGIPAVMLREPTEKTDASREIRRILRTVKEIDDRISRELLDLFLIDRIWDIENQIKPALASGATVLLDRYFLSTAAYQAASVAETEKIMTDYLANARILMPDKVIFLNLPVKTALERLSSRAALDVYESENRLARISERYAAAMAMLGRERSAVSIIEKTNPLAPADFDALSEAIAA
jgi:dTMP kinase